MVERLLPIPEVRSLNPFIGKYYIELLMSTVLKETKIKKKRPGMANFS